MITTANVPSIAPTTGPTIDFDFDCDDPFCGTEEVEVVDVELSWEVLSWEVRDCEELSCEKLDDGNKAGSEPTAVYL